MLEVTPRISIPEAELGEEFVRASGPGGQNVNKVSSAVMLRYDIPGSSLPPDVKERLLKLVARRATAEGVLLIKGQQFRTQERNRQDARDRLVELVRLAAIPPIKRVPTKPSRASKMRTLEAKVRRGGLKRARKIRPDEV